MSHDEFDALMITTPIRRRAFYALCALTGLRWVEAGRLRWVQYDGHTLDVQAGQTKNKMRAHVPVPRRLAAILKDLRDATPDDQRRVFRNAPSPRTWRRDLVKAGICSLINPKLTNDLRHDPKNLAGYEDERGHILDRKCLRMTFCTWLKESGVDLRDAQRLMRHSDPALTSKVYTDVRMVDLHRASEAASIRSNSARKQTG